MFSRSEKTEEVTEAMAEPSGERSPMVLAALAGLLAIAGAFLLVWYLSNGDDAGVAQGPDGEPAAASGGTSSETDRQVLVVTQAIPRGTSARELIDSPTVYLSARAVPEQFVAASAITSIAELNELDGLVLASEALPGEQLLRGRFRDPNNSDASTETFLEAETGFTISEGKHAVVMELPSTAAYGGNIAPGEWVTVVAGFRIAPPESESFEISVVALNAIKVLAIQTNFEFSGELSGDLNQQGTANRGSVVLTVEVAPEELTDLTYAMTYGNITLATAVKGLDNEEDPRAITGIQQLLGDNGVWLTELEDGNLVDLLGLYPTFEEAESQSIVVDLADDDEEESDEDEAEEPAVEDDAAEAEESDLGDS